MSLFTKFLPQQRNFSKVRFKKLIDKNKKVIKKSKLLNKKIKWIF